MNNHVPNRRVKMSTRRWSGLLIVVVLLAVPLIYITVRLCDFWIHCAPNNPDYATASYEFVPGYYIHPHDRYKIVDTDEYGRVMILCNNPHSREGDPKNYQGFLLIIQTRDDIYISCYNDVCYLEFPVLSFDQEGGPSDEQIELFKQNNDWNKPIDYSKCTVVSIDD